MKKNSSPSHHHHHDFPGHVNSEAGKAAKTVKNTNDPVSSTSGIQDEWVTVGNQKKDGPDTAQIKAAECKVTAKDKKKMSKANLASNSFYLPKNIEKKLHKNNVIQKKQQGKADHTKKVNTPPSLSFLAIMGYSPGQQDFAKRRQAEFPKNKKLLAHDRRHYEQRAWKATLPTPLMAGHVVSSQPLLHSKEPPKEIVVAAEVDTLLDLPFDILARGILPFLGPKDLGSFGSCSSNTNKLGKEGFLWQALFQQNFPKKSQSTHPVSMTEWKLAYQVASFNLDESIRCFHTKKTFLQEVLGLGVDFTVNPVTKVVDYIDLSQDLLSHAAFQKDKIRSDVFGNKFTLFLPLYFSKEHFHRALPLIQKAIVKLCPDKKTAQFDPTMVLDVFPKIVTTFVVLLSDEGVSASRKSFDGVTRIHRLFLALAQEYPQIQQEAAKRLQRFIQKEENRSKHSCPSLGLILPLLMVVNQAECNWPKVRSAYLHETFDRAVLWVCKSFPQLEKTHDETGAVESTSQGEERMKLTRDAMTVPLRLTMFHVYFLNAFCQGTVSERARKYDIFFFQPTKQSHPEPQTDNEDEVSDDTPAIAEPSGLSISSTIAATNGPSEANATASRTSLSFEHFRDQTSYISSVNGWKQFFHFVGLKGPKTKDEMARLLRHHVQNSRRKKYHRAGMDFSRVHASGTSKILAKGQQYRAPDNLQRVVFTNVWSFEGHTKYLDATCLLYNGKERVHTVDYRNTHAENGAVQHSGDVMSAQGGTHTIHINLAELPVSITSCVFVISAWADATLADIISPSISFRDEEADDQSDPLCTYDLDSHDKISHLKSVFMCRLYRSTRESANGGWHVVAIGDSHRGSADNYGPIYKAAVSYL